MTTVRFLCTVLIFFASFLSSKAQVKDNSSITILYNAKVYTVNKSQPWAEALVVKNGKILFVGSNKEAFRYSSNKTDRVDCHGNFLMPGFIEGHGHLHGLGAYLNQLRLKEVKSWEEIVAQVAAAAKNTPKGQWIIGRGWHQEKWNHPPTKNYLGYPYHEELDRVSPYNPVILYHASGHGAYVNAKAMELMNLSQQTKDPVGGSIVRDAAGEIVGMLEESAQQLAMNAYQQWRNRLSETALKADYAHNVKTAEEECLRRGITSFQDAGIPVKQAEWMQEFGKQNKFKIRHYTMVKSSYHDLLQATKMFPVLNNAHNFLTINAVKVSLDGALGSYGAWLLESYTDRENWTGLNTFELDSLKSIASWCWKNNVQLCVHAIGDKANRETLNIFENEIKKDPTKEHRWRVEHAQHIHPSEIPRFAQNKVIASMQSVHCTSDAPYVIKRLGEERASNGAYRWRDFMNAGVVVTNGTDAPVEDVDPLPCLYAAVTRKPANHEAFYANQIMTREEALYSYTMANAFAAFQEKEKGSIEIGKFADLVLLDKNLSTCSEDEILQTKVISTWVGGIKKYDASEKKKSN